MSVRKTTKEFIREAKLVHGDRYDYSLADYHSRNHKIKIICKDHGEFEQLPYIHTKGHNCPKCSLKEQSKLFSYDFDMFYEKATNIHNNTYQYDRNSFTTLQDKMIITCKEHGDFSQTPTAHLRGQGCPECGRKKSWKSHKMTFNEFVKKSNKVHNNRYTYDENQWKSRKNKTTIYCEDHGNFQQYPADHLQGKGCPKCNSSKGELQIESWLKYKSITYESQKRFDSCKNIKELPFDFFLPEYNILIEYDGIQHYEPVNTFGGEKAFIKTKHNDSIKTNWALNSKYNLIRISYKDSIEKTLQEIFCRH